MDVGVIVTCPRSQARANDALFPVKSDAYPAILPCVSPMFPTKVEGLIQNFDGYKASDSDPGWCWSVEHMVHPVVTLGFR
jgi:hypothetical protein